MEFINWNIGHKIPWFLDTEDKVSEARQILVNSTHEEFERLKIAKINTLAQLHNIILD